MVTGETAPEGKEPYEQATPEAVIHQVMERDSRELSAIEQIRQSQEWASGTGHVLNLWAAAMRGRRSIPRLTPNCAAPLPRANTPGTRKNTSARHCLRRSANGCSPGHDVRSVIREITLSPLDGARSVSAVLHGRLGKTVRPDAPVSWTARTPESAGEIARATAEALDAAHRSPG